MNDSYVPGVCNIGPAEIRQRATAGYFALAVTVLLAAFLIAFDVVWYLRLLIFLPASGAAIGFVQARMHFCAGFGMKGIFNVKSPAGKTETVEQQEFRNQDRRTANRIILYSLLTGAAVTVVVGLI